MPKLCEFENCRKQASYGDFFGKPISNFGSGSTTPMPLIVLQSFQQNFIFICLQHTPIATAT